MSTQRRVSRDLDKDISAKKPQNSSSDMVTTYQVLPKHLDLSTSTSTSLCMRDTKPVATKTLQEPQDGKPAITLKTYKQGSGSRLGSSCSVLHLFKPINDDGKRNAATIDIKSDEETEMLAQLRAQLEEHFQGLKREFEVKRGKCWTALRPWGNEEWEWSEEGGDEIDGALDWCSSSWLSASGEAEQW
ncbi:hypothetical protein BDW02DRAFT_277085 [Decorospora gaudefroyi]|uniref:Uncharacterized protein n=1 Tax=Decorospora gaudefroyi TaxID=184978 RepID=A0A6A5KWP8_9PLEO|nr:hypothetical protein BDW02DRAFT_277085 [Decorospora gaudefroyi]